MVVDVQALLIARRDWLPEWRPSALHVLAAVEVGFSQGVVAEAFTWPRRHLSRQYGLLLVGAPDEN